MPGCFEQWSILFVNVLNGRDLKTPFRELNLLEIAAKLAATSVRGCPGGTR